MSLLLLIGSAVQQVSSPNTATVIHDPPAAATPTPVVNDPPAAATPPPVEAKDPAALPTTPAASDPTPTKADNTGATATPAVETSPAQDKGASKIDEVVAAEVKKTEEVKPADKPAEQPADKPAENTAEKQAEKAAEKPAENPAEKPAAEPVKTPEQTKEAEIRAAKLAPRMEAAEEDDEEEVRPEKGQQMPKIKSEKEMMPKKMELPKIFSQAKKLVSQMDEEEEEEEEDGGDTDEEEDEEDEEDDDIEDEDDLEEEVDEEEDEGEEDDDEDEDEDEERRLLGMLLQKKEAERDLGNTPAQAKPMAQAKAKEAGKEEGTKDAKPDNHANGIPKMAGWTNSRERRHRSRQPIQVPFNHDSQASMSRKLGEDQDILAELAGRSPEVVNDILTSSRSEPIVAKSGGDKEASFHPKDRIAHVISLLAQNKDNREASNVSQLAQAEHPKEKSEVGKLGGAVSQRQLVGPAVEPEENRRLLGRPAIFRTAAKPVPVEHIEAASGASDHAGGNPKNNNQVRHLQETATAGAASNSTTEASAPSTAEIVAPQADQANTTAAFIPANATEAVTVDPDAVAADEPAALKSSSKGKKRIRYPNEILVKRFIPLLTDQEKGKISLAEKLKREYFQTREGMLITELVLVRKQYYQWMLGLGKVKNLITKEQARVKRSHADKPEEPANQESATKEEAPKEAVPAPEDQAALPEATQGQPAAAETIAPPKNSPAETDHPAGQEQEAPEEGKDEPADEGVAVAAGQAQDNPEIIASHGDQSQQPVEGAVEEASQTSGEQSGEAQQQEAQAVTRLLKNLVKGYEKEKEKKEGRALATLLRRLGRRDDSKNRREKSKKKLIKRLKKIANQDTEERDQEWRSEKERQPARSDPEPVYHPASHTSQAKPAYQPNPAKPTTTLYKPATTQYKPATTQSKPITTQAKAIKVEYQPKIGASVEANRPQTNKIGSSIVAKPVSAQPAKSSVPQKDRKIGGSGVVYSTAVAEGVNSKASIQTSNDSKRKDQYAFQRNGDRLLSKDLNDANSLRLRILNNSLKLYKEDEPRESKDGKSQDKAKEAGGAGKEDAGKKLGNVLVTPATASAGTSAR